ncbi:MAG TPA: hypothetical protein ENJ95_11750, partial [Bacteroidetes bacterium]|nr:hypothetical protein [Bacteroidota bacterium]
ALVYDLFYENENVVWAGTKKGLIKWDVKYGSSEAFPIFDGYSHYPCRYNDLYLLITIKNKGIYIFNKKKYNCTKVISNISREGAFSIDSNTVIPYLDNSQNLWVSIEEGQGGLIYANLGKTKFRSIPMMQHYGSQAAASFQTLVEDGDGNIWCSTFFDGIFLLDAKGRTTHHYFHNKNIAGSLPSDNITHLLKDKKDRIWVASFNGVALYGNNSFRPVPVEGKPPDNTFLFLHQLKNGKKILASSLSSGVYEIAENKGRFLLKNILPAGGSTYFNIYEDRSGNLYFCRNETEIEIYRFQEGHLKLQNTIYISAIINGFYEDVSSGTCWLATSAGLVSIDSKNLGAPPVFYTEKNGLPNKYVQAVMGNGEGDIFISTNKGLALFNKRDGTFRAYTLSDGTLSNIFLSYAALKRGNGEIWFGGSNGITIVPPEGPGNIVETPPKIKMTGIKINDERRDSLECHLTGSTNVSEIRHLVLPFKDRTISFEFVAMEYSDPRNNQLWYKLENVDLNWVRLEKGEPGFARYPNLSFGDYIFKAQAFNSDGFPSGEASLLKVTILPPWYLRWWAISFYVLSIAGLIYAYYRFRINQIRQKEEALRKEAEFRQKEAQLKQQVAETETAILRLQMNPHFIFNSLNSINSYILKKDIGTASSYLGRFSKLIRKILDLAAEQYVTVYEEKELLELYMQTEAVRFEDKFSFEIKVDDTLDPDDILLPTMILQPFVENAIWHGISGKDGKGHITVHFQTQDNCLLCT